MLEGEISGICYRLRNEVFPFSVGTSSLVNGHGFVNDRLISGDELLRHFSSASSYEDFTSKCQELDGAFSVIHVLSDGRVCAAVDNIRSFPLFIQPQPNSSYLISDYLDAAPSGHYHLDAQSARVFKRSLFVPGDATLLTNCRQVQAGSLLLISDTICQHRYECYTYMPHPISDPVAAIVKLESSFHKTFTNMINFLDGRTAVIPLSGGHDSRLILFWLQRLGYRNVITFSYGDPNSDFTEHVFAEQVAGVLDYPYFFIDYSSKDAAAFIRRHVQDYLIYASNASSLGHIQDLYAIHRLQNDGIITGDSVIVPGYSEDFLAGSHLQKSEGGGLECALKRTHHSDGRNTISLALSRMLSKLTIPPPTISNSDSLNMFNEAYEAYDMIERQAKFIQNAVRAYEYFGISWFTPYWQKHHIETWMSISNKLRQDRSLFMQYEKEIYPANLAQIGFEEQSHRYKSLFCREFDIIFRPRKYHYLNSLISPFGLIKTACLWRANPNDYFRHLYMEWLKEQCRKSLQ